jgi:type I restriction enzyme S subunit
MASQTEHESIIKEGFKETKLGVIPNDWDIKELNEVGDTITGLTYSPKMISNSGVLVLRSSNVQNRTLSFNDNVFVNVKEGNYNKTKDGDILICVRNGSKSLIGKNALIDKPNESCAFGAFMLVFRSPNSKYLYHLFDTDYYNKEIHRNLGATINSINTKNLQKFRFPFPKIEEQKAIAKCLNTWDTAIDRLKNLIDEKELQKKALMQQLLTGKKRLKGFNDEWKEKRIEEVAQEYSAKNHKNENIEVLSCTKYDGLVPSLKYFGRKVYGDDLSKYKVVPKNYFAYATNHIEEGSIGYQGFNEVGLVSPMYTVFKTDNNVHDKFFFRVLKSHKLIHEYNRRMEGSIDRRGGLRWKNFKRIKVQLPRVNEQKAIENILLIADKELGILKNELQQLKKQKKGLMQQLLTGKKRLKF